MILILYIITKLLTLSRNFMLDSELVSNHRDKFAVRRLRFRDINRVSENEGDAVDVAARPCDFNRVTDGAFDAARRRFVFLSNCWI